MRISPLIAPARRARRARGSAAPPAEIGVGIAPVVPDASTFWRSRGLSQEAGVTARLEGRSAATLIPFLASNRVQVVQGGLSLGYFNAVAQGLRSRRARFGLDPGQQHDIVRTDIADEFKTPGDLKGKRVGIVAPGSIPEYGVGKVLETAGWASRTSTSNTSRSRTSARPSPTARSTPRSKCRLIPSRFWPKGSPRRGSIRHDRPASPTITVAYMVNTDWAAQNKEAAHRVMLAFARAGREYCDAYHHGPTARKPSTSSFKTT